MADSGFDSRDRRRRRSPSYASESGTAFRRRDSHDRGHRSSRRRDHADDDVDNGRSGRREKYSNRKDRHRDRERGRHDRDRSPKRQRRRSYSPRDHKEEAEERQRRRRRDDRSRSQERRRRRPSPPSRSPSPSYSSKRSRGPLPSQEESFHGQGSSRQPSRRDTDRDARARNDPETDDAVTKASPPPEKQKPNFERTGALARETNTVEGTNIVLKYNEPPEARKPPSRDAWRLYVFKGPDLLETVEIFTRSCWLVGREKMVVDFPIEHPSCSKQHAVIQFRHIVKTNEYGDKDARVRPYIIDLESANGTKVNGEKIPATRYVELQDKDMVQFGLSTREYVLMLPPG
ncbi:SMAD/FHA domain-containing protein [Xylona heveae TC161]|uniref:SMAD/FHA domain-containing protein n=1 Tax=Xylona heveae (strain CBS 132557 / TC161) TaxID=1328760 RepID=A0A165ICI5_XYLHT|nr:SMAD/FHA domain-containing protein [Xylona heveae TC161]KZF24703.1 SMAD/FHA domain-containing protein [Xylona heveae TC161]